MRTKVVEYKTKDEMDRGMADEQNHGWNVTNIATVDQGWAAGKTFLLGCLFLPLALLGKKKTIYSVTYGTQETSNLYYAPVKQNHSVRNTVVIIALLFLFLLIVAQAASAL